MTPAETAVRGAFAAQAEACAGRGSPFTGLLCGALGRSLDRSTEVGRRVLDWPGRPDARGDSVPLRLAGGLHALVRRGRLPRLTALYPPNSPPPGAEALGAALAEILAEAEAELLPWLDRAPQTNEPMRSAPLMAGLLAVAAETRGCPSRCTRSARARASSSRSTATSTGWAGWRPARRARRSRSLPLGTAVRPRRRRRCRSRAGGGATSTRSM